MTIKEVRLQYSYNYNKIEVSNISTYFKEILLKVKEFNDFWEDSFPQIPPSTISTNVSCALYQVICCKHSHLAHI